MINFPTIHTERLLLRPIAASDADFVIGHFLNPEVQRFLLDEPALTTPAEALAIIDFYLSAPNPRYNRWVIVRQHDGCPIGTCGFHKWVAMHQRAEIGYDLSPSYWGHGYMFEAIQAMLDHGFGTLGLHRIEALVARENQRSARLLERLGFRAEGVLREYYQRDGQFFDHIQYALIATDRPASVSSPH
ncbi:MAG: GNAT family protein [Roseiflexaceae bacterium]